MNITDTEKLPFLKYISQGAKQIECRVATDYVRNLQAGGVLKLESSSGNLVLCEVPQLNFYKDFENMLKKLGFQKCRPLCEQF